MYNQNLERYLKRLKDNYNEKGFDFLKEMPLVTDILRVDDTVLTNYIQDRDDIDLDSISIITLDYLCEKGTIIMEYFACLDPVVTTKMIKFDDYVYFVDYRSFDDVVIIQQANKINYINKGI